MDGCILRHLKIQPFEMNRMGVLGSIDETLNKADKVIELLKEKESLVFDLLNCPVAGVVITDHNLTQLLKESLENAMFPLLSRHKGREIVSLDCKGLKKGDAYGWMVALAEKVKEAPNLIAVIENIAEIPSGPQCDDPHYVENLLGHSWKNNVVFFGDNIIDATQMTILLTSVPAYQDELGNKYRADSYTWIMEFDKDMDDIDNQIKHG